MTGTEEAQALGGFRAIPISELQPSPNNPRENLVDIDGLALSIKESGMIQPIIAQRIPGQPKLRIVAGHRRHAAALRLGWAKVPVIVRRDLLPDEELLAMLVENGQRAGLDPIEEARALQRLKDQGDLTNVDLAAKVGRPASWVKSRLLLLELPLAEQERVRVGHYTLEHATALVRADRAQQRQQAHPVARPVGRPKGAKTRPYFGDQHPHAQAARARCDHRGTPKVGGVACGACWEAVIRQDERAQLDVPSLGESA